MENHSIPSSIPKPLQRRIYSVSELTREIKVLLEDGFPFVWLDGEISNFSRPASGHYYFSLKDASSQIGAVMFRGQCRTLKFVPENGMKIVGLGRISVYEPRGTYQVIFEYLEPQGVGALQIAFEQLKQQLAAEGLFDAQCKKPLPFLPRKISVVTSPTGAVIHDIIQVIGRRFPNMPVVVVPVKVQGNGAVEEIVAAMHLLETRADADVIIVARGGGSLEDLQAFNSEKVARAIFAATIPVISAVGHETDFTIADFAADLRAATPSVAAELAVPVKAELIQGCVLMNTALDSTMNRYLQTFSRCLREMSNRLADPRKRIQDLRLRIDDNTACLSRAMSSLWQRHHERLDWRYNSILAHNPLLQMRRVKEKRIQMQNRLVMAIKATCGNRRARYDRWAAKLAALSPMAILERGYSIARTMSASGYRIIREADTVEKDQKLEILLAKGSLTCRVEGINKNGKKNI